MDISSDEELLDVSPEVSKSKLSPTTVNLHRKHHCSSSLRCIMLFVFVVFLAQYIFFFLEIKWFRFCDITAKCNKLSKKIKKIIMT